ncbi:MAG TPA: outer membrane protein [Afifellaceae bacterium]|nr:outer membrane protein [Afifellaceae bacterium]
MHRSLISAVLLAASASLSQAADLPAAPPVYEAPAAPPVVYDWTGLYAGLHGGYGFGTTDLSVTDGGGFSTDYDIHGWLGGAQIGYNYQFGPSWLLGVEADIALTGIEGDYSDTATFNERATTEIDWLGTVRARAGWVNGRFMPFITGGVAFAGVDHRIGPTGLTGPVSTSDTLFGWTAGGGLEALIDSSWSARLDYLYVDLEDVDFTTAGGTGTFDDNVHLFRLGVNYQF